MRLVAFITVLVIAAGFLAWEFVPIQVTRWVGHFPLTVHVASSDGTFVKVYCSSHADRGGAEDALKDDLRPDSLSYYSIVDPFDGKPVITHVRTTGSDSFCGRELNRHQFRYLAVIGVYEDGRRVSKVVEIPDGRVSKEIRVELP